MENMPALPSFDNTEAAFSAKSDAELRQSYRVFKLLSFNSMVRFGSWATSLALALRLPIQPIIRYTVYNQFCGGESLNQLDRTITLLAKSNIKTILDYGVEGKATEADFEKTMEHKLHTMEVMRNNPDVVYISLKITGIGRFHLLERIHEGKPLNHHEQEEFEHIRRRMHRLCMKADETGKGILFDAEESWIQRPLDDLIDEMMAQYNRDKVVVYNTFQLYRHDRLEFLIASHKKAEAAGYILGAKLVRGAYMEKERERARVKGYPSPIHKDKESVDIDYNTGLDFCLNHIERIVVCCGTHNEASCLYMVKRMQELGLPNTHPHIFFAQLYGMGEHITFNLAKAGYCTTKWVTYGPIKEVMPYLIRRAQENSSVSGQVGRELGLLQKEMTRRRLI
jgi:proline dehydrogenase